MVVASSSVAAYKKGSQVRLRFRQITSCATNASHAHDLAEVDLAQPPLSNRRFTRLRQGHSIQQMGTRDAPVITSTETHHDGHVAHYCSM
jgi:hypothetical protein